MSESLPTLPPFAEISGRRCDAHPARGAVALCRRCLTALCAECATRRDGVNFCARCVADDDASALALPGAQQVRVAERNSTRAGALLGTPARVIAVLLAYSVAAIVAAAWAVGMPFFANERRLEANRERVTEVNLALASYFDDVGRYPSRERGLAALLAASDDDRDVWRGPYTTAQATGGKPAPGDAKEPQVLDVFGRPLYYYAKPDPDGDEGAMLTVYVASPGANGTWDTPGIENGDPPREAKGDDVLKWVVWQ
ncbi:MAG TPA: type II secretion system protein GspG [bacterium]|nr:type II secretion system protein GspG [bacterium]